MELRIGTRGSLLALWQANWVRSLLESQHPGLTVKLVIIKTKGDKILDVPLAKVGGKGLFVKELEEALLAGEIDLAVHSMKDVPGDFPEGLGLGPILTREDPRDALLSVNHTHLENLPPKARVGSSSLRRQSQLLHRRPDLQVIPLRGNVNTRIEKLCNGEFDAILLAAAGVKRLGLTQYVKAYLPIDRMLPAAGQGAVGIELRLDDTRTEALLAPLNDPVTQDCVRAERAFLHRLQGGCQVPIAAHAISEGEHLHLQGLVADLNGGEILRAESSAHRDQAETLGRGVAETLLQQGAEALLATLLANP
ncbi:MAG: hydroxymethylbilane synthase [Magnetococcales bacterium]|nr:hydroxymethylbilane synthase [Magnetococcales bacterium]